MQVPVCCPHEPFSFLSFFPLRTALGFLQFLWQVVSIPEFQGVKAVLAQRGRIFTVRRGGMGP